MPPKCGIGAQDTDYIKQQTDARVAATTAGVVVSQIRLCSLPSSWGNTVFRRQFSITALALGNFAIGLSVLLPTGMVAELSSSLGVTIGTAGLLVSLGAGVVCVSPPLVGWTTSRVELTCAFGRNVILGCDRSHGVCLRTELLKPFGDPLGDARPRGRLYAISKRNRGFIGLGRQARLGNRIGLAWLGPRDRGWIAADFDSRAADWLASDL